MTVFTSIDLYIYAKQNQEDQASLGETGIVLSSVLFNAMMGGIANKERVEDKGQGMKTLILEDKIMIWRKDGKQTEEKLNQRNLIIEEYELKLNMDKAVTEDFKEPGHRAQHKI
jgi:hypothetical protein